MLLTMSSICSSILTTYLIMYLVTYKLLLKNKNFCNLEYERRLYIVKNYVKSIVLCVFSIRAIAQAYYILFDNSQLDDFYTNTNALIYVLTDTIGLILVRNLPSNTKIHHLTTNLLGVYVITSPHYFGSSAYLPVLYASFSSLSFIVNFYLAFRAHEPTHKLRNQLSYMSYYIYTFTSLLNWVVQVYYLTIVLSYGEILFPFLYCFCLAAIIYDDIILMSWLKKDWEKRI